MRIHLKIVGQTEGNRGDELRFGSKLLADRGFVARADAEKQIGLAEKGLAIRLVVDGGGKFLLPGEDIGEVKGGSFGRRLEESYFFIQGEACLLHPAWPEIAKQVACLLVAKEEG